MQVELYPDLLKIIQDLKISLFQQRGRPLLFKRNNEEDPLDIDLSFSPVISEKTVETFRDPDVCTLCSKRVGYKPDQFTTKAPHLPFLILIQNSFKLSRENYFENSEENQIFINMIKAGLNCHPGDLLVREILRCYFGKTDEKNHEFTENCLKHLREDIARFKIRGILILGQAASLLFDDNKEKIAGQTGKVIKIEGIPAIISPGPNRIRYMNENKFDPEKVKAEKVTILNYLKKFKSEIMDK